jgi:uncharacterized protein YegJ (DUF2314 family)
MYIRIAVGVIVVVGIVAVVAFLIVRSRRQSEAGPISIVMLRNGPRNFSVPDIRAAFRRVHRRDPQIEKHAPDETTDAYLLVDTELPPLGIIDSRRQYADPEDLREVANRSEHSAVRGAIREHKAWVSIDAMGVDDSISKEERSKVYSLLAPLAAELMDDRCMLLYLPAEGRVAEAGERAEEMLRAGQLAELFGDNELNAPMFHVSNDDERINAAIKEARSRLPEFCSEFARRGEGCTAMVKARFQIVSASDDGVEVMWVKVRSIDGAGFTGTVENNPVHDSLPRKGAVVKVKLDDVVDWAYVNEAGEPQGLFVDRILMGGKP